MISDNRSHWTWIWIWIYNHLKFNKISMQNSKHTKYSKFWVNVSVEIRILLKWVEWWIDSRKSKCPSRMNEFSHFNNYSFMFRFWHTQIRAFLAHWAFWRHKSHKLWVWCRISVNFRFDLLLRIPIRNKNIIKSKIFFSGRD